MFMGVVRRTSGNSRLQFAGVVVEKEERYGY